MHIHIYISNYSLLGPYNVTCMYAFRDGHLALDNQLVCCSFGKFTSPAPSFPQLPVVVCVGLRPRGCFLVQFDVFVGVILVYSALDDHVGETLLVKLLMLLGDTVSQ